MKGIRSLLVANRGEIAIRVMRAAAGLGIRTVAIHPADDGASLHVRRADEARILEGAGVAAYLDAEQIVSVATAAGCDAIHPGYGFLSESAAFARLCAAAGITFVGPSVGTLETFGDKAAARALADRCGVPLLEGTRKPTSAAGIVEFLESLGPGGAVMIKAVAGGGGRGMRAVHSRDEVPKAFERCSSEAGKFFGNPDVYVERLVPRARHIEVQIIGDGSVVSHLWERECSAQRRHQKILEVAPAPNLDATIREQLLTSAVRLAREVGYRSLGTFEFLVDDFGKIAFLEANPRLQVEHTVTEEATGVDLVQAQLRVAVGATLADLGLGQSEIPAPRGFALEVRVNMETIRADGTVNPAGGTLEAFDPPSGPGVRVDSFGYAGYATSPAYDSLLAKVIVCSPTARFGDAVDRCFRALCEFRVEGVRTNIPFLQNLLRLPEVVAGRIDTKLVDDRIAELVRESEHPRLYPTRVRESGSRREGFAGARVDAADPLAVLDYGRAGGDSPGDVGTGAESAGPDGTVALVSPMQGTIVSLEVSEGEAVAAGAPVLVMEAMKMEHLVKATVAGIIRRLEVAVGDAVYEGRPVAFVEPADVDTSATAGDADVDPDHIRPDLAEVIERHRRTRDEARPEAVARRRKTGQRTARENIADLCDPGSFFEYGPLVVANQWSRYSEEQLIDRTPTDGFIMGMARINGDLFPDDRAQCVIASYDYTVLAGTQGIVNHAKIDRIVDVARKTRRPLVIFTEGGGGRPGDDGYPGGGSGLGGLALETFIRFPQLSGLVPVIGVNSGRCFAGNAALLGVCDVVIATRSSNIGMGGPAMVEGGGLGVFRPEEIGPSAIQYANGVIDILCDDDAETVRMTKRYLAYFQGVVDDWECPDQRLLRRAVPENRLRAYDVREVVSGLADEGSVLELRRGFGPGMITALIRIEGRAVGVVANNPLHLGGAIDTPGADKAARFIQLCNAFDVPLLSLIDTPGMMVGPEVERTALVRHCSRLFLAAGNADIPILAVVLRKAYGLGAIAMTGGAFTSSTFIVSWPTGEFGGMGLEGAVKLGFRKELAALGPAERKEKYEQMVAAAYRKGRALRNATGPVFDVDDVIDPAETRAWIVSALRAHGHPRQRSAKKVPFIDSW